MDRNDKRFEVNRANFAGAVLCSLALAALLCGCSFMNNREEQATSARYFPSPEAAVPVISDLLRKNDFLTLASYYDLTGSAVTRAELESGEYFIRQERPEAAHPSGAWRYKHPFPPGFTYRSMSPGPKENVFLIQVETKIDQGEGAPSQRGIDSFLMVRSDRGWQILPDAVTGEGELPATAPGPLPDPPWKK